MRWAARELRFVEPTRLTLTFRPETGFYSHRLSVSGRYSHFRNYRTDDATALKILVTPDGVMGSEAGSLVLVSPPSGEFPSPIETKEV